MKRNFIITALIAVFLVMILSPGSMSFPGANVYDSPGNSFELINSFQVAATESEWIDVDSFDATYEGWTQPTGASPWLDAQDHPTNFLRESKDELVDHGWFGFPDTTGTGTLTVNVSIWGFSDDSDDGVIIFVDETGSGSGTNEGTLIVDLNTGSYKTLALGAYTVSEVNLMLIFLRTTDTVMDDIEIDHMRLGVSWEGAAQSPPVNDQQPTLDNADDTDNMYAQYKEYQLTVYVSDINGFPDIDYLEVSLWDDSQTTEYWRLRYDEDTNTFTEEYDSGTIISLNAGGSSATETGNDIDATFYFTIDWDHTDLTDTDFECYVIDDEPESDTDWYETNLDVETRLDYSSGPAITSDAGGGTVDRGDLDGAYQFTGTLIYYTSVDDNPATDQVDVWVAVTEYGSTTGPFSDLTLTSGAFDVTCYADDALGLDTATVKPVIESAGSGGTSLYYTTDLSDTYISDQIIVISYAISGGDDRINTGATVTIDVTIDYDYDDSDVTDGTVTVNGLSAAHQGVGVWRFTDSEATVLLNTYDTVVTSGNAHGITDVNQNGQSETCIWDEVIVISYSIIGGDDRIDTGATVTIDVTVDYDYDNSDVTDGTIVINGLSGSHQGVGVWRFTDSEATVMMNTYDTVVAAGNTHGITVVNQNGQSETTIWDEVQVQSYSRSDDRDNINDNVDIDVTLWYDYDNTLVTDGTVTINSIGAAHQGSGVWRITENEATVQLKTYDTVACSGNAHGITVVDQNGQSTTVIWDQIIIQTTVADDTRVDVDANSEIRVTLWLDYDDSYLGSGDTVNLDDTGMSWDSGNSWFDLARSQASVGLWNYYVNSTTEATYGITAFDLNSQDQDVIWDRIIILTTTTQDGRISINTAADLRVTAQLEYDSHALGSGDSLYMNDTSMNWVSTYFQLQPNFDTVGLWNFYVNSSSANEVTYGITVVNLDSNDVDQIWDRLIIDIQADNENPDNGIEVTFTLTVIFDYDDASCTTYEIAFTRDAVYWETFTNANKSLFVDTNTDVAYDYTGGAVNSESTYGILAFTSNTETVTWSAVGNDAPVNDTQPTSIDLHDSDNLYAYIVYYSIIAYVSDLQGFADIDYLEISCYSNDQVTKYWTVRYDEDTNTFSEIYDPSDVIFLDTGASSATEAGNDIDATFEIRINWNHVDFSDCDFFAYVIDDEPESDSDWYENDWDFETRLDYSSAPAVSSDDAGTVDHGDLDETFSITGTIIFYGGTVNPTTAIVDVWILGSEYGSTPGPWSDLTLTAGAFDVTCYADDAIGQDTYTIKVVIVGDGSGGTDQYYTTSATDTYIADRIQVQVTTADDTRVDISTNSEIRVTLWLQYDASWLGSGDSVNLDDTGMSWDAVNSWFDLARSQGSVGDWIYYVNSSIEATHGITGLDLNSKEISVIWDSLTISLTDPSDQRINIDTSLSGMVASAIYDYDGSAYDGSFTLNNTQFSYSTAQIQGYKVDSADGDDTYGITAVSSNTDETYCIWDSLTATISPPTDQRINIAANASGMVVSAIYDYDSAAYDGTLSLNDENYAHSTVGNFSYYVSVGDGDDTHGITTVSSYQETWCIFDRLLIVIDVDENNPINDQQVNFTLTVTFDFDDVECTTYEIAFTREAIYWETFTNSNKSLFVDTNSGVSYIYTSGNVNDESTYEITAYTSNSETVKWSEAGDGGGGAAGGGDAGSELYSDPYFWVSFGAILFLLLAVAIVAYIKAPSGKSVYADMKGSVFR